MNKPVIIITGASSGIGAATARSLARENVCLTLAARRADRLQGVASDVEKLGSEALIVRTDVTNRADIHHMVQSTIGSLGADRCAIERRRNILRRAIG